MSLQSLSVVRKSPIKTRRRGSGLRALIIGAGEAGRTLARDFLRMPEFGLIPVGFLDDDKRKRSVAGLPVFGRIEALNTVAAAENVAIVVIAIPALPAKQVREIAEQATEAGVSVRYLPSFVAALERVARVSDLRRMRVDELLGRSELHVVRYGGREAIAGRRVLVTGAGGSIGSELCRQIRGFGPQSLHMLDHDESNLHSLQIALDGSGLLDTDELIVADVRDEVRVRQIFEEIRPEIVFHAAAHKHLPLLERYPCEGVKSNVLGTLHLVRAAIATEVERFILISTDKAADPTSILGATKRLAELILETHSGGSTLFGAVRFGNVLGTRGSFLSVLAAQVENGEAVTVTHPDASRFFMTVEEAVGLVLEAAGMVRDGQIFVLDMGEPVRIVDLVRNYAAQLHLDEDQISMRFTGLRPGEKLDEALFSVHEQKIATSHPKIWTVLPQPVAPNFRTGLERLFEAASRNDAPGVKQILTELLPDYVPAELPDRPQEVAPYPDWY
jgi:FlaA1/EpsC-like NDP-sugar epimerase